MLDFHKRDITADMDAVEDLLDEDRKTIEFEKSYDDERQKQASAVMLSMQNSVALVIAGSLDISVPTAQVFVSYFFVFCVIIFISNILKNTLFVYKQDVTKRLGSNVHDIVYQFLTIIGLFFFYLLFALIRSYFTLTQSHIPFVVIVLGLFIACSTVWNRDTQGKKIA